MTTNLPPVGGPRTSGEADETPPESPLVRTAERVGGVCNAVLSRSPSSTSGDSAASPGKIKTVLLGRNFSILTSKALLMGAGGVIAASILTGGIAFYVVVGVVATIGLIHLGKEILQAKGLIQSARNPHPPSITSAQEPVVAPRTPTPVRDPRIDQEREACAERIRNLPQLPPLSLGPLSESQDFNRFLEEQAENWINFVQVNIWDDNTPHAFGCNAVTQKVNAQGGATDLERKQFAKKDMIELHGLLTRMLLKPNREGKQTHYGNPALRQNDTPKVRARYEAFELMSICREEIIDFKRVATVFGGRALPSRMGEGRELDFNRDRFIVTITSTEQGIIKLQIKKAFDLYTDLDQPPQAGVNGSVSCQANQQKQRERWYAVYECLLQHNVVPRFFVTPFPGVRTQECLVPVLKTCRLYPDLV